jgi:hypothetical protein
MEGVIMTALPSLWEYFASLPDPRSPLGRRHPLPAILSLITVAVLCGARSLEAIAQFPRDRGRRFAFLLGFTRPDTPCKATLSNLLRCLDIELFEAALSAWISSRCSGQVVREIAIDGKTLRGSVDGSVPSVHLLAAYAGQLEVVLRQLRVDCKTNEHKTALELLQVLPLKDVVVSADAMFTHVDFCEAVLKGGGDYILPVKDNQPQLLADIALAFETPQGLSPPAATPA